jgi:hypothetical protein
MRSIWGALAIAAASVSTRGRDRHLPVRGHRGDQEALSGSESAIDRSIPTAYGALASSFDRRASICAAFAELALDSGVTHLDAYIDSPVVAGHLLKKGTGLRRTTCGRWVERVRHLLTLFAASSVTSSVPGTERRRGQARQPGHQ